MAEKAKLRKKDDDNSGVTVIVVGYGAVKGPNGWNEYLRWVEDRWAARFTELRATMTLDSARKLLSGPGWACACVGRPWCCRADVEVAREVVYAASVVAHFLDSYIKENDE
jgi:hypothetical protein